MNSIIIIVATLVLLIILHHVKSDISIEYFRQVCPSAIKRQCNKKLIASALNNIHNKLFALRKSIIDDNSNKKYDEMYTWYLDKVSIHADLNRNNIKVNDKTLKKYIKKYNTVKPIETPKNKFSIAKSSVIVDKLIDKNIQSSVKTDNILIF